ncbi:MAG: formate dehydrogenase accessory sulfurtransferase FdhD [Chloroflexi bacterium]|nr:formate dehydrogenase accessory sulfurtransferase FdhD [Chloroflexota bacterium]
MDKPYVTIQFERYSQGKSETVTGKTIAETPVTLTVNNEAWLTFMCTPIQLEALAVGFLYNERLIDAADEIADVRVCEHGDNVDVWLTHNVDRPTKWARTSGCTGGRTAIQPSEERAPVFSSNGPTLEPKLIGQLLDLLFDTQGLYGKTGGVHTSILSDGEQAIFVSEDIGRHNTLDKLAGLCLLEDVWPKRRILLTTGRISSEMLQKAARISAPIVISRTSPSSLSVQMAQHRGITLIGYARRNAFNVYAHPERILQPTVTGTTSSHQRENP